MQIIEAAQFDNYWKEQNKIINTGLEADSADTIVREIIQAVRLNGDAALKIYTERFDKSCPEQFEVPFSAAQTAWDNLCKEDPELAAALKLAGNNIKTFADLQRKQYVDFEKQIDKGLFTGQRIIPVECAAVYVPAGRFPLFSSVLMGMIPALAAGVQKIFLASPPMEDRFPDHRILAAAALSISLFKKSSAKNKQNPKLRIFAIGGAQAIAALALGTESIPRSSVIVGPGNKYVAAAKRLLFGEVGIDFIAGPSDVLLIADEKVAENTLENNIEKAAELIAADILAQAEHDPDARARALVPSRSMAEKVGAALEKQLTALPAESQLVARASLDSGGLIVIYNTREEAIRIANSIAPEHMELHVQDHSPWINNTDNELCLKNYGSLFIGSLAAEVLGDYSAGVNHTLPTSGGARYTGGLSVQHFLKTVTTLRCVPGTGFEEARKAAEILGLAEGLTGHAQAAYLRRIQSTRELP